MTIQSHTITPSQRVHLPRLDLFRPRAQGSTVLVLTRLGASTNVVLAEIEDLDHGQGIDQSQIVGNSPRRKRRNIGPRTFVSDAAGLVICRTSAQTGKMCLAEEEEALQVFIPLVRA